MRQSKFVPPTAKNNNNPLYRAQSSVRVLAKAGVFLFGLIVIGLIIPLLPVKAVSSTPNAPSGLYKSSSTATSITINWTDNSSNETGFRIYRNGSLYDLVGANTTSYTDTGLACGTTYSYYVTAINSVSAPPPPRSGSTSYSASNTNSCTQNYSTYSLSLVAGETLNIGTCGVAGSSGSGDTYLRLYLGGSQVASNDDACGVLSNFSYTASSAGTYVLRMGCYASGSCSGTVAYTISSLALKTLWSPVAKVFNWLNKELGLVKMAAAQTVYESAASNTISASTAACLDTTPPTNPTSLSVSGSPCSGSNPLACSSTAPALTYSWNAGTDAGSGIAGYQVVLQDSTTAAWVASAIVGNALSTSLYPSGLVNNRTYYTWVRAYDNAGNWNGVFLMGNSVVPQSDTTPPTFSISPTVTVTGPSSGSVSYSDPSGIAQVVYCILTGSGALGTCVPYQYQTSATVSFSTYTPTTVVCHNGSDTLGNWSSTRCSTFYVTPPSVLNGDFYAPGSAGSGTVSLQWAYFSSLASGFSIYRNSGYIGSKVASYPPVSSYNYIDSSCPVAGNYTYQIIATNSSGAATSGPTQTVYKYGCDVTPPTGSLLINDGNLLTGSQTVNLRFNCSDGGSGCNTYAVYTNGDCIGSAVSSGTISYSGYAQATLPISGYTMYASVNLTDYAGNSSCVNDSIYYDVTPPTGTISINSGASFTTAPGVNLSLSCADNSSSFGSKPRAFKTTNQWLSWLNPIIDWLGFNKVAQAIPAGPNKLGCEMMQFSNDGVTYSTQEAYTTSKAWTLASCSNNRTVYVKYLDAVGNAATYSSSITCDNIAPAVAISSPAAAPAWQNSLNFTVTPVESDAGSGLASCYSHTNGFYNVAHACNAGFPSNCPSVGANACTVTEFATDAVGNRGSVARTFSIDTTAPTCSVAASGSTLTATCSDSGSGCFPPVTKTQTATTTGTYTFSFNDNAGNTGSCSYAYTAPPTSYTHYTYSAWSACGSFGAWNTATHTRTGTQTRTVATTYYNTTSPSDTLVTSQACTESDTLVPVVSSTLAKSQGRLSNSSFYDQSATSTNANDPMFIVTFSDSGSGMNTNVTPTCELRNAAGSMVGSCSCNGAICTGKIVGGNVNGTYTIKNFFDIKDNAGNLFNESVLFSVDNRPPIILKVQ